ncbi:uncharacterized protein LOC133530493 [Cydia pomonella]|uniref:uncharacterized protein LOC133530493 n=1 Tax=Cydia pomonella TaxID=82600 RepID=UPI002ADE5448|nr:uncharacterized protein LOC133530493 [Cydia pomonella]
MLASWMHDNKSTNRSNGLKFVQFMKNRAFHSGIKQSPYQAMFGTKPKVGLTTSKFPLEIINGLNNEEELQLAITELNRNFSDNDNAGNQDEQENNDTEEVGEDEDDDDDGENVEQETINHNSKETMILEAREKAHCNLAKQAKRMKTASDQSHPPLKVGDNLIIPIPDVDKGKADLRNVIGVVLEVTSEQLYKIGTKSGILNKLYCRSEFDGCEEKFLRQHEVPNVTIALRTVAKNVATGTGQGYARCVCFQAAKTTDVSARKRGCCVIQSAIIV